MGIQNKLQNIFTKHYRYGNLLLINADCVDVMKHIHNNAFDLAIVDPPYGINKDGQNQSTGGNGGRKAHEFRGWDDAIPEKEYFDELFRVSKNQIIWGANYMTPYLPPSMGWILWDKGQRINQSDGELAFTSFEKALRVFTCNRVELLKEGTMHPTQKPIKLYSWLLTNYAKIGDKILDTHGGSFNSAIAAWQLGFDFVGIERDETYFKAAIKRVDLVVRQVQIFKTLDLNVKSVQENMF